MTFMIKIQLTEALRGLANGLLWARNMPTTRRPQTADGRRARKATANRILTVLRAILNRAFEKGLVADDTPWRRVKPFKRTEEPRVRFLTVGESVRLINASREDFRLLVRAALLTGARYGELIRLVRGEVDLDRKNIFIQPSKSGRGRHVPLNEEGVDFFRQRTLGKAGDAWFSSGATERLGERRTVFGSSATPAEELMCVLRLGFTSCAIPMLRCWRRPA